MPIAGASDTGGQTASPLAFTGGWWFLPLTLTFSGAYSLGGETLDLSRFIPASKTIRKVIPVGTARGLGMEYDTTAGKLKMFETDVASNAVAEHSAAAYDADVTATPIVVGFWVKAG